MRLPWPFRRSAPDGGAPATAAQGTVQPAMAPVRRDWAGTGDLRPSFVGDPGIRVQRFPADIAGSHLPPPILAPLGHERSADGPAGLVSGLARPTLTSVVPGSAGRSDLPLRRRGPGATAQRAVAPMPMDDPGTPGPNVDAGPAGVPGSAVLVASAAPGPSVAPEADGLPILEPRRVPTVASGPRTMRAGALTIARTPDLTFAPARPATPDPGTRHQASEVGQPAPPAAVLASTSSGASMRTILRTASGSRVRLGPPIQRSGLEGMAPALELAHPGRETGALPSATPVQRHPSSPDASHDDPGDSGRSPSMAPLVGGLATALAGETLAVPAARDEGMPGIPGGLVLARALDTRRDAHAATSEAEATPPMDAPGAAAPLVGASIAPSSGLRPTVLPPMSTAPAAGETGPGGVHVRAGGTRITGGPTAQRAVAAPGDRQVSTSGSAVTARGRAQGHAPAHGMPLVQRVAQPAGLGPVGAGGSVAAGEPAGATRMPPAPALVLARSTTTIVASAHGQPMSGPAGTLGGAGTSATVLRDAADPVAPDAAQPDDGGGAPGGAPGEGTSTSTTARAAPSATGSVAERDLDEMVRRLYPRLRRSLSSELLVARERAGTLADLR